MKWHTHITHFPESLDGEIPERDQYNSCSYWSMFMFKLLIIIPFIFLFWWNVFIIYIRYCDWFIFYRME